MYLDAKQCLTVIACVFIIGCKDRPNEPTVPEPKLVILEPRDGSTIIDTVTIVFELSGVSPLNSNYNLDLYIDDRWMRKWYDPSRRVLFFNLASPNELYGAYGYGGEMDSIEDGWQKIRVEAWQGFEWHVQDEIYVKLHRFAPSFFYITHLDSTWCWLSWTDRDKTIGSEPLKYFQLEYAAGSSPYEMVFKEGSFGFPYRYDYEMRGIFARNVDHHFRIRTLNDTATSVWVERITRRN